MLKIKLDDVDELYNVLLKLGIITSLQQFMLYEAHIDKDDPLQFSMSSIPYYLIEQQVEIIEYFKELLDRIEVSTL